MHIFKKTKVVNIFHTKHCVSNRAVIKGATMVSLLVLVYLILQTQKQLKLVVRSLVTKEQVF